jgi:tRNA-specific 2-thiouridylase
VSLLQRASGQVRQLENSRYVISKGIDETKDQSYVPGACSRIFYRVRCFLGYLPQKRRFVQMAHDFGYPELAKIK